MNKKINIFLLSSLVATGANTIKSESIAQKFQRLERLQQEIFEGVFDWVDDEKQADKQSHDLNFAIDSNKEAHTLTIAVSGIEIEGEQPDANVEMSEEKNLVQIKLTPNNGVLNITAHDALLSLNYNKQKTQEASEENPYHYAARSYNQTQMIDQHIDPTMLPEFSYNKDEKKLSILLHTIPEKGYQKKTVPISLS